MCAMVNSQTLKNIMYDVVILSVYGKTRRLESEESIEQFLGLNIALSQEISYRCIIQTSIVFQGPKVLLSLMYLNKCTDPSKFTLPGFVENVANLCTAKTQVRSCRQ